MMETTLNVNVDVLRLITRAADSMGISRSEMITVLIRKLMNEHWKIISMGRMVKYQQKSSRDNWHTFHLILCEDDYEYFLDLRKLRKMSVSFLLAYAVKKYLCKEVYKNITDNYRFNNYAIIKEVIDNIICWRIYWGKPPHMKNRN